MRTTTTKTLRIFYFDLFGPDMTFPEFVYSHAKASKVPLITRLMMTGLAVYFERKYGELPRNDFYTLEYKFPKFLKLLGNSSLTIYQGML